MKRNTNPLSLIALLAIALACSSLMLTSCTKQDGGEYFKHEGKILIFFRSTEANGIVL